MNSNKPSEWSRTNIVLVLIFSAVVIFQYIKLNQADSKINLLLDESVNKDQTLEVLYKNYSSFHNPNSSLFYDANYIKPDFARKWRFFDEVTDAATSYGIVVASAHVGTIKNEASGETSAIAIYVLQGSAGAVNYYIGDDGYKNPGEIQYFYAYGGDNGISGNPKIGDIVSFREKGTSDLYSYGWTIFLTPKNVSAAYDFAKQLINKSEYDICIAKLNEDINWLKTDQKLLDDVSIETLKGEFKGPTLVRRMEKHSN